VIALLLRLYPARWRARYGDEFASLLQERPIGPFDVADVLLGALDAHLHLRGLGAATEHAKGFAMSLRIGGYAAIAGGILWFSGLALSSWFHEGGLFALTIGVGTLALLIALVGLSAFQARQYPRLVWAAFIVPAVGAVVSLVGMAGMATMGDVPFIGTWSAWSVWAIGVVTLIVGSALFGMATLRARALSRPAAATLAVSSIVVIPMLLGLGVLDGLLPEAAAPLGMALAALAFAGGWVGLGVSALRVDRASPVSMAGGAA
jgi:hypothetical protein